MKSKYYKKNKEIYDLHKTRCCICGEDAKCCLEFHHVEDKLFNISKSLKYVTPELLLNELRKTCVVCSNCHIKLHNKIINVDNNYLMQHKIHK